MHSCTKFVAFLDVLGYSELLKNNDIAYVRQLFEKIFKNLKNKNTIGETYIDSGNLSSSTYDLNIQMISDSIIIWTKDDLYISLQILVEACTTLIRTCFKEGLPLRGGISVGQFDAIESDDSYRISSIIGDAIINAHNIEKKQKWMGCIIDKKCFIHLNLDWEHVLVSPTKNVIEYDVPCFSEQQLAINWCNFLYDDEDEETLKTQIIDSFNAHNKISDSEDVKIKIKHTLDFFKYVKQNNQFIDESIR